MPVRIQPTKWMPKDKEIIRNFLKEMKKICEEKPVYKKIHLLHPPINSPDEFEKTDLQAHVSEEEMKSIGLHEPVEKLYIKILTDPEINMFFHQMFWQQQKSGIVPNWQTFIALLNYVMTYTPVYCDTGDNVGFPINALINWPMATTAGFACFLNDKVNALFKEVLSYWGQYLQSADSASVLNTSKNGWLCDSALKKMIDEKGNTFEQQYICDPSKPHWGFTSWDDFFIRRFRDGMRPLPTQTPDSAYIIANACESAPFKIERNVTARAIFWIKQQPYSLSHMLNNNQWFEYFTGGTVYQGFLSATSYHRWHSPISGTIIEFEVIEGSYYSQTFDIQDDYSAPNMSQGYCTQVAARAAIYVLADNPDIGIMCFMSIGMSEVSSNEVIVKKGQHVKQGDELGTFHFGGSSHCLIFRPGLTVDFDLSPNEKPGLDALNIPLRRKIATVSLKPK